MSEEIEESVILCARVSDTPDPVVGSVVTTCHGCQEAVWLSAATLERVGEEKGLGFAVKMFCFGCLIKLPGVETAEIQAISNDQAQEMLEHLSTINV